MPMWASSTKAGAIAVAGWLACLFPADPRPVLSRLRDGSHASSLQIQGRCYRGCGMARMPLPCRSKAGAIAAWDGSHASSLQIQGRCYRGCGMARMPLPCRDPRPVLSRLRDGSHASSCRSKAGAIAVAGWLACLFPVDPRPVLSRLRDGSHASSLQAGAIAVENGQRNG
ncbi:hypothetical protein CYMTET_50613 [Cymbomonas tetramitiformis]|uniref:Uncharacterized protein n=1 Tax=Cymbomonas tetramitiformis TaxID=36881 RepID=A0AAE0BNX7_9CHLO|nr:hypothetical protein CYMTET_50613 [Cymbomonas tetramitiformis]